ncbi:MAG: aldolase [Prevotella sp.]|nr:aldolase [Prevotella sp.]
MAIKLMYIANEPNIAHIAERNGVDRIFVDLEVRNKAKRQKNIDSVKSHHCLNDIKQIKDTLTTAELLVRSNAMYEGSQKEIDEIVCRGADIVMLPMWTSVDDAKRFRDYINGRAKVMLLLETIPAEKSLDEVLELDGIDEILIGLNDLHLQYKMKFLFELLANGKIDELMNKMVAKGLPCGFGGIASLDKGMISGRNILAEHYRLHSSMAILSRSFCDTSKIKDEDEIENIFHQGIIDIRDFEEFLTKQDEEYFEVNHQEVIRKTNEIIDIISKK